MSNDIQQSRTVYLDYLRIFATFSVVVLHVSAQNWGSTDVAGFNWQVFNAFDSIVRWGVPVFLMISGALFLNRDISTKKLYSKYIFRMSVSFVVWSVIYALFNGGQTKDKLIAAIKGHYHMWFILMIIGVYMCVPLIKPIVENNQKCKYYLILALIFAIVIPQVNTLINDFGSDILINGMFLLNNNAKVMQAYMVLGYVGYFVLGYYVNKIDLNKSGRRHIYILGLVGFATTIVLTLSVSLKAGEANENYYLPFTVNVLLEALAVFTWFKHRKYNHERINFFVQRLSKYSFGAYLVHALVLELLKQITGLNTLSFNPILSVCCISVLVFVLSFAISGVLNHIPVVKKYMV